MSYHDVVILFPGHGLEDFPTDLPDEKALGLLNAFAVAWHPALLAAVKSLPVENRADVPPAITVGRLILVPPACDELVPAGWIEQARADGATVITGVSERDELARAVLQSPGLSLPPVADPPVAEPLDAEIVADFFALGTCRLLVELLTRRMHHFGTMDEARLRHEAISAAEAALAGDLVAAKAGLGGCFEVLTETRERFYPVECYLLDLCLLIPRLADAHLTLALANPKPLNVLATAADLEQMMQEKPELKDQFQRFFDAGGLDVLGGEWRERPVPLVPLASMLREFEKGHDAFCRNLGRSPETWARRRYGFSTLLPQILHRYGYRGGLHVALDDGLYPDTEQSKIRWEGCDGTVIDATTRIPLAAESASSYLRFPSRMAESMQQDQTASVIWARWPEVRSPFWQDIERIHNYAPVLGRFVTFRQFFEHADDPGRQSRIEESEYLSPFLIQAVAAQERDPIGRFQRHFQRRARFDAGAVLNGLASILREQPIGTPAGRQLEDRIESSGPDLPSADSDPRHPGTVDVDDAEIDAFVDRAARRLGEIVLHGAAGDPGYLVLNPLSFDRTVSVELPKLETPPPTQPPIRSVQLDAKHRRVMVDLPACGYVWIPARGPKPARSRGTATAMSEGNMIRNEFIEVHVNEATGGIARIKQFGRTPNRLSQQLAFRFPRERTPRVAQAEGAASAPEDRTFYSHMRCSSIAVTSSGPGLGEIVTTGKLIDPEDGSVLAEYGQTVRVWRSRPIIELEIELRPTRLPDGDPWSNYFASRFAWNDSAATLTRSVLGGAHGMQWERFESPHFFEIATETHRTTLLFHGLPFHRKTGPRMLDSLLVVAGETARRFRFGIAVDRDYPMQSALDGLVPPVVLDTPSGPPPAGRSGWLFHLDAKNVQILQILPLQEPKPGEEDASPLETPSDDGSNRGFGFRLRLYETEGRQRPAQIRCFRTPTFACQRDFRGRKISILRIVDDAVYLEPTPFEILDVELRFGEAHPA
jgi:alpha-mannosidase